MADESMRVKTKRSAEEALDELQREYNVRARCFPRWIQEGRVSKTDAQDRLDRLGSAIEYLAALEFKEGKADQQEVASADE